jgi:chorismate mutase
VSYIEDLATYRGKIDRIDIEIIDHLKKWVQVFNKTRDFTSDLALKSVQEIALEHGLNVEYILPIFQALIDLAEKERGRM